MDEDYSSSSDDLEDWKPRNTDETSQNKFEECLEAQGTGYDAMAKQENSLLGPPCCIVFNLPDGSQHKHDEFRMGHTVEWLKQAVEDKYGLPYLEQKLLLNDKVMIDPLSLSDIADLKTDAENQVIVKMPEVPSP
eukprot:NODE_2124_length_634_cov_263.776068_g1670_i0.p1 GENE.NODE_2124_length_634_cov_263.776068_g1670_i0~~NODE_2124_length_634_cov_263.776068_g1670_i0.p1  ORF type:complete len:135 (+),score=25.82 NODE_2124_length_634_cov_263.776068_g1670_i0:67-471(+)